MSSSISRQLVLWLAVPLMLLALCGALVHYFNNVAPGMIASDRRLKAATNALMARLVLDRRTVSLDAAADGKPALAPANSIDFSVRDQSGRLLLGACVVVASTGVTSGTAWARRPPRLPVPTTSAPGATTTTVAAAAPAAMRTPTKTT